MHLWGWWQEVFGLHDHPFGIEENSDKCTTILEIHSPTNIGEVQKLNGRLALQSRFLPRLAEKAKPFYKLLWKTESFLWDEACMQAFLAFKKTITTPTILSQPQSQGTFAPLLLVAKEAINSALDQEEGKHQIPIYFISRILHDAEKRY